MDSEKYIELMQANANRIAMLVEEVGNEQARWKPDEKSWSILEVVNHLYDEEREDFRVFIDYALNRPGEKKPKIDPQGWAVERKYNERDLKESLQNFLDARKDSIEWLNGLQNPNWDITYEAPWGPIRAGDVFSAWVAHDILHIRQITRLHYQYFNKQAEPYITLYAGEW